MEMCLRGVLSHRSFKDAQGCTLFPWTKSSWSISTFIVQTPFQVWTAWQLKKVVPNMIPALMDDIVDGVALRLLDVLKQEIVPRSNAKVRWLGWVWNIYIYLLVHPYMYLGVSWSNLTCAYFSNGLVQPSTRKCHPKIQLAKLANHQDESGWDHNSKDVLVSDKRLQFG